MSKNTQEMQRNENNQGILRNATQNSIIQRNANTY